MASELKLSMHCRTGQFYEFASEFDEACSKLPSVVQAKIADTINFHGGAECLFVIKGDERFGNLGDLEICVQPTDFFKGIMLVLRAWSDNGDACQDK